MSHDNIFIYWDSRTTGSIECFEDQKQTSPMDLDGVELLLIAKKKITDTDDNAIFSLIIGDGLELDSEPTPKNKINYIIPPLATVSLPRTKNTTLWVELLSNPNDAELRQTIELFELPVRASIKENYEGPS